MAYTHEKCRKPLICYLFMVFDFVEIEFVHARFSETGEF